MNQRSDTGIDFNPVHESWMAQALCEADRAAEAGDVPVGCVIVDANGMELARGRNRRECDQDPTAHAEIVALRAAAERLRTWHLDDATVYVTLEPCAMCAGALVNARIKCLVYGASDSKAGAVDTAFFIGNGAPLNHRFQVVRGIMAEACVQRLRRFFEALRAAGEK
jgi:tRNA(adenine34) deaminase